MESHVKYTLPMNQFTKTLGNEEKKNTWINHSYTLQKEDKLLNKKSIIEEINQILKKSTKFLLNCQIPSTKTPMTIYSNYNNNSLSVNYLPNKRNNVPHKTLLLDLDETLIHSSENSLILNPDMTLDFNVMNHHRNLFLYIRPNVFEFLNKMSKCYELVIYTASVSDYANLIIDRLDKEKLISHRLYREHCIPKASGFIKDLETIGRKLKDTIILDNNPFSYSFSKENGIPISAWYSNKNDNELMKLVPLLEYLSKVNDVQVMIKQIITKNTISWEKAYKLMRIKEKSRKSKIPKNQAIYLNTKMRIPLKEHDFYQKIHTINNKKEWAKKQVNLLKKTEEDQLLKSNRFSSQVLPSRIQSRNKVLFNNSIYTNDINKNYLTQIIEPSCLTTKLFFKAKTISPKPI